MNFGIVEWYLIGINILGFVLYGINKYLYDHTPTGQIDAGITIVTLLGGSLGVLLFILLFDRRTSKGNMMSRLYLICVLIVQIVVYLFYIGKHSSEITFAFWRFFATHRILIWYLVIINVVAIVTFGIDKIRALEKKWRIPIISLLLIALVGGSVGSLIGMYAFKHKTQKDYFTVGIPLIIAMQVIVTFYLMNIA